MSKINAVWHRAHRMPKNPTTAQRLTWHIAHAEHCLCREMPESIKRAIAQRPSLGSASPKQSRASRSPAKR